MTMSKFRKLKIHTKYQTRRFGEVKIPEIRLEGKWLDELGFKQGQTVTIELADNKLTITVDKELEITTPNSKQAQAAGGGRASA